MTLENPLWLQNLTYAARLDRKLVELLATEGVKDVAGGHLKVSERAAGANMSVDIAAGTGFITGDDQANQGRYLVPSTAVENRAIAAADPTDPRIDLVVGRVRDANVTGVDNDWIIEVITGTPAAAPTAPAVPNTAIPLAEVEVPAGAASIVNANITDRRTQALSDLPIDAIAKTLLDAKGDLVVASAADAAARLPVGADGQVLTADAAAAAGVKWAAVSGPSDHGALTGLADDDHAQYLLANGTRALTGALSAGSNKLTNVADPTNAQDAATKNYVDTNLPTDVDRAVIAGFSVDDIDSTTAVIQMWRAWVTAGGTAIVGKQVPVVADRAGSVVGISVAGDAARTAGAVTFEVYINGAATGLSVTIDGTNTQYHYATQASGLDTYAAGDRIDIRYQVTTALNTKIGYEAALTLQAA